MGFWLNKDALPLQFGLDKAVSDSAGDYLVYGETREVETYVPLIPFIDGTGSLQMPAAPVSFSGTGNFAAAGILSPTAIIPLQITAPAVTASGGTLTIPAPQLFFEQVEIVTLVPAAGGTSLNVGLAFINPATNAFIQCTPNAATQIIKTVVTANMATTGQKITWNLPGSTGIASGTAANNTIAGGGDWLGNVPLVNNAVTPLPTQAFISCIASGAFTNGLIKVRLKYTIYGAINQ